MKEDISEIEALYDKYLALQKDIDVSQRREFDFNTGFNYTINVEESGRVTISDKACGDFTFVSIEDAYQYYKIIGEDCNDLESWLIACELALYRIDLSLFKRKPWVQ